jgi:anaerobic selenocysteine-containing dehydrogenase
VEQITDVPADQLVRVARLLHEHGPVAYYAWSGVGQHTNATQTDRAISLLYALTGSFDAPGGNVVYERIPVEDLAGLDLLGESQLEKAIDRSARPLGPVRNGWVPGHSFANAVLTRNPYPIRGLVGFGSNLLLSQPNPELMRRALARLDFFVHCDMFMTPTAELADIVLPVSSAWEREGLRNGFEVTQEAQQLIQLRPRAVAPRGDTRSDNEIVFDLAGRLGLGDSFFGGDIDDGYRAMLAPSGVTLEQLRQNPAGIRVPLETRYRKYAEQDSTGYVGFNTPSRRVELYLEEFLQHDQDPLPRFIDGAVSRRAQPEIASRYPLTLTTAKMLHFCHSQHRALPRLRKANPEPLVEIHPTTAVDRDIGDGDWVTVETVEGSVQARARFNPDLLPDVVCAQFGWWQSCPPLDLPGYEVNGPLSANYNLLIGTDAADPISGSTPLRSYLCEIRGGKL